MVVTASRMPQRMTELTRAVSVIEAADIERTPVQGVADIIGASPGVDMRRRGPYDVQSDISIRGTTFEQATILLDGFRMTDPQTGHHNLNVPVHPQDIAFIEVLRGHGSRMYGPNALGGVVHITTKQPTVPSFGLNSYAGQFGLLGAGGSAAFPLGITRTRISAARSVSEGYRHNTDFDVSNVVASTGFETQKLSAGAIIGYNDKEFGANNFYAAGYPDQWEHTRAELVGVKLAVQPPRGIVKLRASWRHHYDEYVLNRTNPSFYRNEHRTDAVLGEAEYSVDWRPGVTSAGIQAAFDRIESSNLGEHGRQWGGVFIEHRFLLFERLSILPGVFAYYHRGGNISWWPGIDMGYRFCPCLQAFASAGRSFRQPTFTELYYTSPANKGNPALEPEQALSAEAGLRWRKEWANAALTVFGRRGTTLVDWVKMPSTTYYQAQNLLDVDHGGVELEAAVLPSILYAKIPVERLSAAYSFIDANKHASGFESKYVLNHLRHSVVANLSYHIFGPLSQNWRACYRQRVAKDGYWLLDTRLTARMGGVNVYADANNLLDTEYEEVGNVPMPGRWVSAGVSMAIDHPRDGGKQRRGNEGY